MPLGIKFPLPSTVTMLSFPLSKVKLPAPCGFKVATIEPKPSANKFTVLGASMLVGMRTFTVTSLLERL